MVRYMHSHYILLWSCIFVMKKKYSTFALSLCLCTIGKTQKNEFALIVLFSGPIVDSSLEHSFSEHDWMKIIYEPLFILNWSLTVDYMKSATRVELVIELMSVRNESFAWVSFLILTVILYQTSIFVMTVMRIKCQCSLWVEFIPPKVMDSLQKGNVSCIRLILSLFTAWIGSFFWCCIVLQFIYFRFLSHCKYSYV